MKKSLTVLILIFFTAGLLFAFNEDDNGFPSSIDTLLYDPYENAEINRLANELENQLSQTSSNDSQISVPSDSTQTSENINEEFQNLDNDLNAAEEQAETDTQNNIDESLSAKDIENSQTDGDPVKLTQGSYEQSETDISAGNNLRLEIKRTYSSESKITTSFGYGWSTNLDERIILGVKAGQDEIEQALEQRVNKLENLIEYYTSLIKQIYGLSDIENALTDFHSKVEHCSSIYSDSSSIASSLSSLESRAKGYPALARVSSLKSNAENLKTSINSKLEAFKNREIRLKKDLELLDSLTQRLEEVKEELAQFKIDIQPSKDRQNRNKRAMFNGMDCWYEETGFNTITLIDENAYPHILYETSDGSGIWKNNNEKTIRECVQTSSGLKLIQTDGTEKLFDNFGFIIQIKERNQNTINITRSADSKISDIKTSSGEHFLFSYNTNYISKISNLRDNSQTVSYSYESNLLTNVCDAEGDNLKMKYNPQQLLTELQKCDGSVIKFEYGQVSNDGRNLTTRTWNEEGFSESFDYNLSLQQTVYTNHDGAQTVYWYDKNKRTTREHHADGTIIEYKYTDDGNLWQKITNGDSTFFEYDSRGNKTRTLYSDGSFEAYDYDSFNELVYYRDRDGIVYEYNRDTKGNLTEYKCGGQTIFEQQIDSYGNVIKRTVYGGQKIVSEYEYNSFGNLEAETTGGIKTVYSYDSQNRVIKAVKNNKCLYTIEYNGRTTKRTDFNGLETTYITNGRKDITQVLQKDTVLGIVHKTRIEYDKRHLPVKIFIGDEQHEKLITEYQYTPEGKIKAEYSIDEPGFVKLYEYNNGLISQIKQFQTSGADDIIIFNYSYQNNAGNKKLLSITDPLGHSTNYEYDAWGNLTAQTDANGEVTQNIFSSAGRLKKSQGNYGGFYNYEYDNAGNLIKSGEENATAVKASCNADGSLKSQTDRYGKTTYYSYDNAGRLVCEQSESKTVWYEYDDFGRLTRQSVGASQNISDAVYYVTYDYSLDGRTVTITEGSKYKTTSVLDAFGNVIKQTDGNGNTRIYEYDCKNLLIAVYDSYSNKTSYEYNVLGKVKSVTLPGGEKTEYFYNSLGVLIKVIDECGTVYTAEYDKAGRLIKENNRADCEKTYEYDNIGRIKKILCGGQTLEEYSYGERGRTLTVTDGNGSKYLYNYDSFGRLITEKNRLGLTQSYYYDQEGELKEQKGFDGSTTTITYSENQTVRTVRYSDGSENKFVYNATGKIIQAQNMYENTFYEYDKGGRLIVQKDITTGEEIRFEYDAAGNRTRLLSSNRETRYTYGANNELKEIFDNLQRVSVQLGYNKNGQEILRKFGNGTVEQTSYDKAGRITLKFQKDSSGKILWGEGYIYGADGKRTATVDNNASVTLYEYDRSGRLSAVYYPYTNEYETLLKKEAQTNGLSVNEPAAINRYLSSDEKAALSLRLNELHYTLSSALTTMQVFIKETYSYDKNGNRIKKITPFGTIEYTFDKENRLVSSGSRGQSFVNYVYDNAGNLIHGESALKLTNYAYNEQNRLIYCEVTDKSELTFTRTKYAYDALGRRILVQDFDETVMRTLYDGFTFDVIKQSPVFANGTFTDTYETGIRWNQTGQPTGERYRYLENDSNDGNRFFYLENGNYKSVSSRFTGERTVFSANGVISAQVSAGTGTEYFSTDYFGSVRETSDSYGSSQQTFTYDAFGTLVQGELSGTSDYGYLGKQIDPTTSLYNYGYRDYNPCTSRFTTVDPIRDASNWFTYCNGDPINFVDLWGLELTLTVNKDTQMMTVELRTNGIIDKREIKVTTGVVSHDYSKNTDKSRTQNTGDKITNPTQYPNGTYKITGTKNNPFNNSPNYGSQWVTTNATQQLVATDGTVVEDSGYQIHLTDHTNTNGCIGIKSKGDMDYILMCVSMNEFYDPNSSVIIVTGGKNN